MFLFNSISATFPKLNIAAPNSPQQTLEVDSITYSENPRTMSLLNSISAPLPKLDIAAPDSPQQALEVDSGTGSEKLHTMARLKPILATLPKLDIAAALLPNQTQETTSFTCFGRLPQEMKNKIVSLLASGYFLEDAKANDILSVVLCCTSRPAGQAHHGYARLLLLQHDVGCGVQRSSTTSNNLGSLQGVSSRGHALLRKGIREAVQPRYECSANPMGEFRVGHFCTRRITV